MIYLADSCGALLMVRRNKYAKYERSQRIVTAERNTFEVFKADLEQSLWDKVTTVGYDSSYPNDNADHLALRSLACHRLLQL